MCSRDDIPPLSINGILIFLDISSAALRSKPFPVPSESLAPFPAVEAPDRYGIAIVGAGDIVTSAHLPAYQKMGYRVSGLFDIDQDRAQRAAADFGVPQVYRDLDALLSDDTVNVVDIAVPPWAQETMVEPIAHAGRHLLCQKPLAVQAARGAQLVATAEQAYKQVFPLAAAKGRKLQVPRSFLQEKRRKCRFTKAAFSRK